MEVSKLGSFSTQRSKVGSKFSLFLVLAVILAIGSALIANVKADGPAKKASTIAGMATLSGTVDSPKSFKAAQVYIRNVDKRILYMVYTNAGKFPAVGLFPGNYEVNTQANGLESDIQKLEIKASEHQTLKLSLHEAADVLPSANADVQVRNKHITFASYNDVYPPGPGKEAVEHVCMACHGENYFPLRPRSADSLLAAFNSQMLGAQLKDRDKTRLMEGALAPAVTRFPFSVQDRKDALSYISKNFGPDSTVRAVQVPASDQLPLDEAQLGKAMYVEYYWNVDPPGKGGNDPAYKDLVGKQGRMVGYRYSAVIQLDNDGNVWGTDRAVPARIVKLDPRTGEQKDYVVPEPLAGLHDLIIDRSGIISVPELSNSDGEPHLMQLNPKTEKWKVTDLDPDNLIRNADKGGILAIALDSQDDLYMNWMLNGALGRLDHETGKISIYRMPSDGSVPYGNAVDKNDNVWMSDWRQGKIAKFDVTSKQWTEFTSPTYPANTRRSVGVDPKNNVWFCIWAAGQRPGKIAKLDQTTGRITEYNVPHRGAQPYEANPDSEGNIWFPDQPDAPGIPSNIARFNPRDQSFTFYPKPQFVADSSRIIHTTGGAVWYIPRAGASVADKGVGFGVLYPDMDKITSFAAYPQNGAPGYSFRTGVSSKAAAISAKGGQ